MRIGYLNSIIQNIPIKKACKGYYLRWWYNGWHYWFFRPGEINMITEGETYRTIGTKKISMGSGQISYNQVQAIRSILLTREVYILTSDGWKNIRVNQGSVITYKNQINGYELEITTTIGSREISPTGYSPVDDIPEVDPGDPGLCEITIGSLIWSCKNYDSTYPNFLCYNMLIENKEAYGCLYTYAQIMSAGFCPAGWHISTLAEWETSIDYIGNLATAGGILKEVGTDHWDAGIDGTDDYGFAALGGGLGNPVRKSTGLKVYGNFWTADLFDSTHAYYVRMYYNSSAIEILTLPTSYYLSVRLVKDTAAPSGEVIIGTQTWKIINVDDSILGSRVYDDNESNRAIYGGLYQWASIPDIEALYLGWHVPLLAEFQTLDTFLGGPLVSGGKLKEAGLTHWTTPNLGADNSSGFTALGAGFYNTDMSAYVYFNEHASFLCSDIPDETDYSTFILYYDVPGTGYQTSTGDNFFSVRLVKDL